MNPKEKNAMSPPLRSVRSAKSSKSLTSKQLNLGDIEHPQKVRVLILTEQKLIFQEYYFLKNFTHVIKLDLSYNKITQFPPGFSFKHFHNIQTLFLHYNKFEKLKNIQLLAECRKLLYLTLFGNPLEETRARHFCLNIIPSLKLMDDKPVKEEEKYEGILNFQFSTQNDRVGFPLIEISSKESSIQFLGNVMREIKMAKEFHLKANPIVRIQRWWKRVLKSKNKYTNFIQETQIHSFHTANDKNQEAKDSSEGEKLLNRQSSHQSYQIKKLAENGDSGKKRPQREEEDDDHTQRLRVYQLKIVHTFETLYFGLQSFRHLLNAESSVFCSQQFCLLKGLKFKQSAKFRNKYLNVYVTPPTNPLYSTDEENAKVFLSLAFYNNSHYLLELKSKKPASHTQLKNISSTHNLVEIDMAIHQKLEILKLQYLKLKTLKHSHSFPFLFGVHLINISASIKIQKAWKGHKVRKQFNALRIVRQRSAARKIQKFIRNLNFSHRQNFLIESFLFLKNNEAQNIVMKLQTFCSLHQIYEKVLEKDPFMKLPFQQCEFQILQNLNQKSIHDFADDEKQLNLGNKKIRTQISLFSSRQPFPSYFSKFVQPYRLNASKALDEEIDIKKFKIIDLLIKGAIQVKKFQGFDASKQKCNYVKFEYLNRQDANQRKFLLCLLTYNYRNKIWVSFHSQKDAQAKANFSDVNGQIRCTHFLKMIYDNDKKEKLFDKIEQYTKEIKRTSEVYWMPVRVRYFVGTVDYSAIMIVGVYKKTVSEAERLKNEEEGHEMAASRKRLNELSNLKTLQNRMALNKLDTQLWSPTNMRCQIGKNLVSFSIHVDKETERDPSINSCALQREKFSQSLRNDNSLLSLLEDSILHHSINSNASSMPLNTHIPSSINLKDSIPDSFNQDKKILIQKVKSSRKNNIELMTEIRKRQTEVIRKQYKTNAEQNQKLIRESSNSSLLQNISKAQIIKQNEKNRSATKHELHSFQNKFLRKGNFSIQHEMREFEKSRSRSNNKNHSAENLEKSAEKVSGVKKHARYEKGNDQEAQSQTKQSVIGQARHYLKLKKQVLKTELKEFSIQLSEGFEVASSVYPESEMHMLHSDSINLLLQEHKRSKELRSHHRREAMSSAASEKYGKLYEQKRRQFLRSQEKEEGNNASRDSIMEKDRVIKNQKEGGSSKGKADEKMREEEKRMLKKKKLVHSVFPEEFYPLQDSQQIGFHLPKINSSNSGSKRH